MTSNVSILAQSRVDHKEVVAVDREINARGLMDALPVPERMESGLEIRAITPA